ncbi:MAG: hypothetical protein ABI036_21000 [Fibrobacteria bacterium]
MDSVWADITVASAKRAGPEERDSGAAAASLFAAPLGASFEEFKPGRAESGADFQLLMPLLCIKAPSFRRGPALQSMPRLYSSVELKHYFNFAALLGKKLPQGH